MAEIEETIEAAASTDSGNDIFDTDKDGPDEQTFEVKPISDDIATPEEIAQAEADFAKRMKFTD